MVSVDGEHRERDVEVGVLVVNIGKGTEAKVFCLVTQDLKLHWFVTKTVLAQQPVMKGTRVLKGKLKRNVALKANCNKT